MNRTYLFGANWSPRANPDNFGTCLQSTPSIVRVVCCPAAGTGSVRISSSGHPLELMAGSDVKKASQAVWHPWLAATWSCFCSKPFIPTTYCIYVSSGNLYKPRTASDLKAPLWAREAWIPPRPSTLNRSSNPTWGLARQLHWTLKTFGL